MILIQFCVLTRDYVMYLVPHIRCITCTADQQTHFDFIHALLLSGTAVAQWLRCCATNRKVAGSIPAGVSGFFIDITVVKVLCYKSEGRWFDPSWCQWIFH